MENLKVEIKTLKANENSRLRWGIGALGTLVFTLLSYIWAKFAGDLPPTR